MEREATEQLKEILLSIARADARELIEWSRARAEDSQGEELSGDLARSVSSMKIKRLKDSVEYEVKLYDKLKAIELYFKLCGIGEVATDGALYIDYGYVSPDENED